MLDGPPYGGSLYDKWLPILKMSIEQIVASSTED